MCVFKGCPRRWCLDVSSSDVACFFRLRLQRPVESAEAEKSMDVYDFNCPIIYKHETIITRVILSGCPIDYPTLLTGLQTGLSLEVLGM